MNVGRCASLAGLLALLLPLAACDANSPPDAKQFVRDGSCPVSLPMRQGVPADVTRADGPFFGQGALWVSAWWTKPAALDSARDAIHRRKGPSAHLGIKYPTFTLRDGRYADSLGRPSIRVVRLDGPGKAQAGFGGYASASVHGKPMNWWPTGITFSHRGCWQVTESVGDTRINYVVQF